MDMKLNVTLLKKLREDRAWSQEHLASVAGLSLRTIQRVEAEGSASAETRMALASALQVEISEISENGVQEKTQEPAVSPASEPAREASAPSQLLDGRLFRHLFVYFVVCGALLVLDLSRNGELTWAKWPLIGWGLGIMLHLLKRRYPSKAA